jgi:FkbM family methyltransferase
MNNGDDCAYYLKKGFTVVAIEANPLLCESAGRRFAAEISTGSLSILNLGVADESGEAIFHVHQTNSVLSTFVPVGQRIGYTATVPPEEFTPIPVETRRLSDIVRSFGRPYYIKIDIEGFDDRCLADLHRAGIIPPYISAEAHTIDSFRQLVAMGYARFKMVAGATVATDYLAHEIERIDGRRVRHDFPAHSAGPFGEDLPGPWMDRDTALSRWRDRGEGWFDLHAHRAE